MQCKPSKLRGKLVVCLKKSVIIDAKGLLALFQLVFSRTVTGLDDGSFLAGSSKRPMKRGGCRRSSATWQTLLTCKGRLDSSFSA